jgi:hypothetical protein
LKIKDSYFSTGGDQVSSEMSQNCDIIITRIVCLGKPVPLGLKKNKEKVS